MWSSLICQILALAFPVRFFSDSMERGPYELENLNNIPSVA